MNYTRIFCEQDLKLNKELTLTKDSSNHLMQVLRKKDGSLVELFNGKGLSCKAEIISLKKKLVKVRPIESLFNEERRGIEICLGMSLIKSEPLTISIQKATELGVSVISPVLTERTIVNIKSEKLISRKERWKSVAIHACQQCGENWLPLIEELRPLEDWAKKINSKHKIILSPKAEIKLSDLNLTESVSIAVGPEGDFTEKEILNLKKMDFVPVKIGDRILRSDTAVISSISAIRSMCKEF